MAGITFVERGRTPGNSRFGRFFGEQLSIFKNELDNLLLPNYFVPPFVPRRIAVTVVVHDLLFRSRPHSIPLSKVLWQRFCFLVGMRRADRIICISEFTRSELETYYGPLVASKVSVIHNPIDPKRFVETRSGQSNSAERKHFLCLSAGFEHKNVSFLEELFLTDPRLSGCNLVIAGARAAELGRGSIKSQSLKSANPSGHNVRYTGYVSDDELQSLFSESISFLFPSVYEGFGMPVFEALLVGLNVVCHRVGAIEEIVGDLVDFVDVVNDRDAWVRLIINSASRTPPTHEAVAARLAALQPEAIARQYYDVVTAGVF